MTRKRLLAATAGGLAMTAATAAWAQTPTIRLQNGFAPDPREIPVRAGGPRDADTITGCRGGFTARDPSLRIEWAEDDEGGLILSAQSASDTTLVVRGPDGNVVCNDDSTTSGGGLNPEIALFPMRPGRYDVWVGRYGEGDEIVDATLRISISEGAQPQPPAQVVAEPVAEAPPTPPPNADAPAATSLTYRGSETAPRTLDLQAGGPLASFAIPECNAGYVAAAPNLRLTYEPATGRALVFSATSEADTTLAVRGPDGGWSCNDDSGVLGLNPVVAFETPTAGRYDVFVGRFNAPNALAPATLRMAAEAPTPPPPSPEEAAAEAAAQAEAQAAAPDVDAPATAPPNPALAASHTLRLRGAARLQQAVQAGGPLTSYAVPGCRAGFVSAAPTALITYAASGTTPLVITADPSAGREDLTMMVHMPDGNWVCNDDGGSGLSPLVVVRRPESGEYRVYVGRFGTRTAQVPATLSLGGPVPPGPVVSGEGGL